MLALLRRRQNQATKKGYGGRNRAESSWNFRYIVTAANHLAIRSPGSADLKHFCAGRFGSEISGANYQSGSGLCLTLYAWSAFSVSVVGIG